MNDKNFKQGLSRFSFAPDHDWALGVIRERLGGTGVTVVAQQTASGYACVAYSVSMETPFTLAVGFPSLEAARQFSSELNVRMNISMYLADFIVQSWANKFGIEAPDYDH